MLNGLNVEKFWRRVDRSGPCWKWVGKTRSDGYGLFYIGRKQVRVHRIAFELKHGEIPVGLKVCHSCDNRTCTNPEHLFLGTQQDNIQDAYSKGRMARTGGRIFKKGQVIEIIKFFNSGISVSELARRFQTTPPTIYRIVRLQSYRD